MRIKILVIAMIALMLLAGCGKKDEKVEAPTEPAMASGTTDANGHVSMDVGNFTVIADVRNTAQAVIPGVTVDALLLHNNVVMIARENSGAYLPSIVVTGWSGSARQEAPERIQAPVIIAGTEVHSVITMQPVQQGFFSSDPPNFDLILSDEWTTETSNFGPMINLFNTIGTSTYERGVFLHMTPAVQQALGASTRTASLRIGENTDFPTFATLCGLALGLSDNDSLFYSLLTYNNQSLPIINIDNIRMQRNYWAQFRLTWGQDPSDLDSHLWTPLFSQNPDSGASHICYYRRGSQTSVPFADLDVDDVTGYGPERVTIYQHIPGVYVYAVHHYSGMGTFNSSGAQVNLVKPDGSVQLFQAPPDVPGVGDDWYWHVCQIDGQTGAVTPINIYSADPPRGDYLTSDIDRSLLKAND